MHDPSYKLRCNMPYLFRKFGHLVSNLYESKIFNLKSVFDIVPCRDLPEYHQSNLFYM